MTQQLIPKLFLDITKVAPDTTFAYKALKGDTLPITLTIRTDEEPNNIIAEIWTNLEEKNETYFHSRKLHYAKKENNNRRD